MNRPRRLTAAFVRTVTRPGYFGDGHGGRGLTLRVHATQSGHVTRRWIQRVRLAGGLTNIGLGSFPEMTLAEARAKALANARKIAQGQDPRGGGVPTFADACPKVIKIRRPTWKDGERSAREWMGEFQRFAFPHFGSKRVSDITSADVLASLAPIWSAKAATARRLRGRISAVLGWAVAKGYRADNPASGDVIGSVLSNRIAQKKKVHLRALPHAEVAATVARVRNAHDTGLATRLGLEFLVLTATRPKEARAAAWSEMDLDNALWTVPRARMKAGAAFRVPLAPRAVDVLREARERCGGTPYVFPGRTGRPLSHTAHLGLLRRVEADSTAHGFRSSFRDWCAETGVPREVAEACLAHVVGGVEAAYNRSDILARRRAVMEAWADYLDPS